MRSVIVRDFEISLWELLGVAFIVLVLIVGSVFALQSKPQVVSCDAGPALKFSPQDVSNKTLPSQTSTSLDEATRELFRTNRDLKKQHKPEQDSKIQQLAKTRKNIMLEEMRKNPSDALKQVLSDSERNQSQHLTQNCVEAPTTAEGSLEVIHADFTDKTSAENYVITTASKERINLHPANKFKTTLTSGQQIKVKGYRLDNDLLFDASAADSITAVIKPAYPWRSSIAEAAAGDTTGTQQTIVLMVYFQNTTQPSLTQASVNNTIFTQMNNYYQETSYNQMSVAGTSVNWVQIPVDQTCDLYSGINNVKNAAIAAADPTVNFANYGRIVIVANYGGFTCGWGGVGTIGKTYVSTADGVVRSSVNWIDQSSMSVETHEFGHNLGLYHAQFANCGSVTFSASGCSLDEYGDQYSPMGSGSTAHMNVPQKEFLGWLGTTHTQTITASGTYTVEPLETTPTAIKGIKIQRSGGGTFGYNYTYYEYRTATGSDSTLNANVLSGALLHNFTDSYTILLDDTPPGDKNTPAMPVGGSYTDPATGTKVTLNSKTATTLTFGVVMGKTDFSTPTVNITSPTYDATVSGTINATVSAAAASGIQKVDFYVDNGVAPAFTAITSPYKFAVDTAQLTEGYHTITAIATDKSGEPYGVSGNTSAYISTRIIVSNNTPIAPDNLPTGQTLNAGASLKSSDGQYRLAMQTDGNLVIYNAANQAIWYTATSGSGSKLTMQSDGNLVVYNAAGQATWNSVTPGNSGSRLVMQTDGNLVVYDSTNKATWSWKTGKIFPTTLNSGQALNPGDLLKSSDGQYRLAMQTDGNLVIYNAANQAIWYTATSGSGSKLTMQSDGNLVVYNAAGQATWNSVTPGNSGSRLVMQTDGNLVVYDSTNKATWSWKTGKIFPSTLNTNQTLNSGNSLQSPNSQYKLDMQSDCNLVIYDTASKALWNSATPGNSGCRLVMQTDGNLVIYDSTNKAVWYTATSGNSGSRLIMQTDGNLVIYDSTNKATWSRATGKL